MPVPKETCSKSRCSLVLTACFGLDLSSSRKAAGEKGFRLAWNTSWPTWEVKEEP